MSINKTPAELGMMPLPGTPPQNGPSRSALVEHIIKEQEELAVIIMPAVKALLAVKDIDEAKRIATQVLTIVKEPGIKSQAFSQRCLGMSPWNRPDLCSLDPCNCKLKDELEAEWGSYYNFTGTKTGRISY